MMNTHVHYRYTAALFSHLFAVASRSRAYLILGNSLLKRTYSWLFIAYYLLCTPFHHCKSSPSFLYNPSEINLFSSNLSTIFVYGILLRKVIEDAAFIRLLISKSRSMRTEKCSLLYRNFFHFLFSPLFPHFSAFLAFSSPPLSSLFKKQSRKGRGFEIG